MADKTTKEYTEGEVLNKIISWKERGIGIMPVSKVITISRNVIVGIKKWGMLDFLKSKGWLIRRIEGGR